MERQNCFRKRDTEAHQKTEMAATPISNCHFQRRPCSFFLFNHFLPSQNHRFDFNRMWWVEVVLQSCIFFTLGSCKTNHFLEPPLLHLNCFSEFSFCRYWPPFGTAYCTLVYSRPIDFVWGENTSRWCKWIRPFWGCVWFRGI